MKYKVAKPFRPYACIMHGCDGTMKLVDMIGDIIFLKCDKCIALGSDEKEKIKEIYEKPINYIKLLNFAGEEVFDTDCMPLRLILMDCIEKLSPSEQRDFVDIGDIYKALQKSEVDRSAIDAELKAMVDSREIKTRDGKVKLLVTWLDLVKNEYPEYYDHNFP